MSNEELVKSKLNDIARMVDNELPKGFGFVVKIRMEMIQVNIKMEISQCQIFMICQVKRK